MTVKGERTEENPTSPYYEETVLWKLGLFKSCLEITSSATPPQPSYNHRSAPQPEDAHIQRSHPPDP